VTRASRLRAAAIAGALLALALPACTISRIRTGRPIGPTAAAFVKTGVAKKDVLVRLGPPDSVGIEPKGSSFEYYYAKEEGESLQVSAFYASGQYEQAYRRFDRLRIVFDAEGRVREVMIAQQTERERE